MRVPEVSIYIYIYIYIERERERDDMIFFNLQIIGEGKLYFFFLNLKKFLQYDAVTWRNHGF